MRNCIFAVRLNQQERRDLVRLARESGRTPSGLIRWLFDLYRRGRLKSV